jgi:hypothetical protein
VTEESPFSTATACLIKISRVENQDASEGATNGVRVSDVASDDRVTGDR